MKQLKKGDVVEIFEDPITCTKLEGRAELVKCYRSDNDDNLSLWQVAFTDLDEGFQVLRTINSEHC